MRTKMPKEKIIAYFIKAKTGSRPVNNSRVQTNGSGPEDRKVLVDAGDRCVPPAKSRPKKRKMLKAGKDGELDPAAVNIELAELGTETVGIEWSEETYTVRRLVREFGGQLPVIVKVDEGHYKEGAVDLARGQVLLVSSFGRQRRIFAKDSLNAFLSLPLDYQMLVRVHPDDEATSLSEIVTSRELPLSATVVSVDPSSDTTYGNLTGERLTFVAVKDAVFLLANAIIQGWTDQSEIQVIPELLQVEFAMATGLRGGSEAEWRDYHGMFSRSVRHLSFDSVPGYQGILREGPDGNELRTSTFLPIPESFPTDDQSDLAKQGNAVRKNAYENVHLANISETNRTATETPIDTNDNNVSYGQLEDRSKDRSLLPPKAIVRCSTATLDCQRPREMGDQLSLNDDDPGGIRHPLHRGSVTSEIDADRIDSMIDHLNDSIDRSASGDQEHDPESRSHKMRNYFHGNGDINEDHLSTTSVQFLADQCLLVNGLGADEHSQMNYSPGVNGEGGVGDSWENIGVEVRDSGMFSANSIEVSLRFERDYEGPEEEEEEEKEEEEEEEEEEEGVFDQPPVVPTPSTPRKGSVMEMAKIFNAPSNDPAAKFVARKPVNPPIFNQIPEIPASNPIQAERIVENRFSKPVTPILIPPLSNRAFSVHPGPNHRHIIPPASPKPTSPVTPSPVSTPVTTDIRIESSSDVPKELESLSVASVIQCLRLLELDKYGPEFVRSDVDGRRLTDMTERVLEKQFQFSPLEASKVIRFVRGWRP